MEPTRRNREEIARDRVEQLKSFYVHATVYTLVNIFITIVSVTARIDNGENFQEAFFSIGTFATPFFWGIGLVFHAARVFGYNVIFGKAWEERQIQKFMEEGRREIERLDKRKF